MAVVVHEPFSSFRPWRFSFHSFHQSASGAFSAIPDVVPTQRHVVAVGPDDAEAKKYVSTCFAKSCHPWQALFWLDQDAEPCVNYRGTKKALCVDLS
jgi:hypothetical protein